ncbi:leishmanolysin-like peptidase [Hyposmocoma kahamanoa]|uniref:leishmanolysin-like peptidase n=1 Tax=Hyposmocoma kahamanoa TaxID=1477025 RepID=UPI000E6D697B|nr:leishmanolysin-like peptidase [Hyposmocoma kahamanoa]
MCGEVRVPEHHLNPCYVCNSTGHGCRALPRVHSKPDHPIDIDGNLLSDGTDAPSVLDDGLEEEPVGVENTDFVLYVSAVETERCRRGLTVAYASHCQQESALDRPVAGHANFCPGELSTKDRDLPSVLSTVKHEMLHALGFSVSLFAFYRDDDGEPLTARRTDTGNPPLDEDAPENFTDSRNGSDDEVRKNPAPFCERIKGDPLRTECSHRRTAVVLCNLVRHETILPRQYQHFDVLPNVLPGQEAHFGGSVSLADYCPYLQEFTWKHKSVLIRGSRCSYEENTPKTDVNFALENYGPHSKCFDHSDRVWEQKSCRQIREWQHWGSGCYKYKCESGRLHIVVGNYTYTCSHAGQVLQIRILKKGWLHKGGVVCPPCRELCAEEFASRNEYCKVGEESPPPNLYRHDILTCGATALFHTSILTVAAILLTLKNAIN